MGTFKDDADWTGVEFRSTKVGAPGGSRDRFRYNGYLYITDGEKKLAQLLAAMNIPFTPDVKFSFMLLRPGKEPFEQIYIPDFVFNGASYVWDGRELIHGIEAKRAPRGYFDGKSQKKVALLFERRRIAIKLLSDEEIMKFWEKGELPLELFRCSRP